MGILPNSFTTVFNLPRTSTTYRSFFPCPHLILSLMVLSFHASRVFSANLPHRTLVMFLPLHPTITGLALKTCGGCARCPLDHLNLPHVTDLQCPARCVEGLAHGHVATATVHLTCLASMAATAINALSTSPLYSLTVEFFPNDYDILARITAAAPHLQKLKLIEKPQPQVCSCSVLSASHLLPSAPNSSCSEAVERPAGLALYADVFAVSGRTLPEDSGGCHWPDPSQRDRREGLGKWNNFQCWTPSKSLSYQHFAIHTKCRCSEPEPLVPPPGWMGACQRHGCRPYPFLRFVGIFRR